MTSVAAQGPATQSAFTKVFRILTLAVLGVATLLCVAYSVHWRLAVDSPLMHYVVYLIHHGFRPYKDIGDSNMPGTYISESAAMAIFGHYDLAWRIYEFTLLGGMIAAMIWMARQWDWVAGVFAGGLFLVLHIAEGPQRAAEREIVITAFLVVGFALLFAAVRQGRPWMAGLFGIACGIASSIKPTFVVLPAGVLLLAFFVVRRRHGRAWAYLLYGAAGVIAIALADVLYLLAHGALDAFYRTLVTVVPAYAGTARVSMLSMLDSSLPRALKVMFLLTVPLAIVNWRRLGRWSWEQCALAAGALFGLWSVVAQGKGYIYHRYIFIAFLLLLASIEIFRALRLAVWPRLLAAGIICMMFVLVLPSHVAMVRAIPDGTSFELTLERDLQQLGGKQDLQRKVECFDLAYGCLNALYHLDILQATGTVGDVAFFPERMHPAAEQGRHGFLESLKSHPPAVFVISDGIFAEPNTPDYQKIQRWPELAAWLQQDYTMIVQRDFRHERYGYVRDEEFPPTDYDSYRIYVHDGSPLLAKAAQLSPVNVAVR